MVDKVLARTTETSQPSQALGCAGLGHGAFVAMAAGADRSRHVLPCVSVSCSPTSDPAIGQMRGVDLAPARTLTACRRGPIQILVAVLVSVFAKTCLDLTDASIDLVGQRQHPYEAR